VPTSAVVPSVPTSLLLVTPTAAVAAVEDVEDVEASMTVAVVAVDAVVAVASVTVAAVVVVVVVVAAVAAQPTVEASVTSRARRSPSPKCRALAPLPLHQKYLSCMTEMRSCRNDNLCTINVGFLSRFRGPSSYDLNASLPFPLSFLLFCLCCLGNQKFCVGCGVLHFFLGYLANTVLDVRNI